MGNLYTPQLMKGGMYLTWGASFLLLISSITSVQGLRHAIKIIGQDSAPSIIKAQEIRSSLADLDSNVANELLTKPGENQAALKGYEERREKLSKLIVAAAENITYGDDERLPIQSIQLNLGKYMEKVQQARDFHQQNNQKAMVAAYKEAALIMDKTLFTKADELDKVNLSTLEKTYKQENFSIGASLFFVIISGLLLILSLGWLQFFLSAKTKRTLNPMLLGASLISLTYLLYIVGAILSATQNLRIAKEDAFTSVHSLRQARALAYSANGDESRYLLDTANAKIHEEAFFKKVEELGKLSTNKTYSQIADNVQNAQQAARVEGISGYFGTALNNITFPGEREALVKALRNYDTYIQIDGKIRQLNVSGKQAEAIALCLGTEQGQSNWAFKQFKDAHLEAVDINLKAMEDSVSKGLKDVNGFEVLGPVAMGAIALLTSFGLAPRLKEYF
jgi:hypothetical protein